MTGVNTRPPSMKYEGAALLMCTGTRRRGERRLRTHTSFTALLCRMRRRASSPVYFCVWGVGVRCVSVCVDRVRV